MTQHMGKGSASLVHVIPQLLLEHECMTYFFKNVQYTNSFDLSKTTAALLKTNHIVSKTVCRSKIYIHPTCLWST